MRGLVHRLLQITHKQWIYRNATIHLKVRDGLTVAQHEAILTTMEGYLHTDPAQLLEENRHLLYSNFVALAEGPTKDKMEWISEVWQNMLPAGPDRQSGLGTVSGRVPECRTNMSQ